MPAIASACVQRSPAQPVNGTTLVGTGALVEVDVADAVGVPVGEVVLLEEVLLEEVVLEEVVLLGATVEVVGAKVVEDVVDDVVTIVPAVAILI